MIRSIEEVVSEVKSFGPYGTLETIGIGGGRFQLFEKRIRKMSELSQAARDAVTALLRTDDCLRSFSVTVTCTRKDGKTLPDRVEIILER